MPSVFRPSSTAETRRRIAASCAADRSGDRRKQAIRLRKQPTKLASSSMGNTSVSWSLSIRRAEPRNGLQPGRFFSLFYRSGGRASRHGSGEAGAGIALRAIVRLRRTGRQGAVPTFLILPDLMQGHAALVRHSERMQFAGSKFGGNEY